MAQIELTWIEKKRFLGVDSTQHSVVLSGGNDVGIKPSDGLLIALAGCAAYDVVDIVQKQRAQLQRLQITVDGEQQSEPPWPYTRIHLRFDIAADGARYEQLVRGVDLALNKYCSVRASLAPSVEVSFEVVLEGSTS